MESVTVFKNPKNDNLFDVKMTVTKGKVLALINALNKHSEGSPVAADLLDMIVANTEAAKIAKE